MKKLLLGILCIALSILVCSCSGNQDGELESSENQDKQFDPVKSEDLFDYIVEKISTADYENIYEYTSEDLYGLISEDSFVKIFTDITDMSGKYLSLENKNIKSEGGIDVIYSTLNFENIILELQISVKNLKICGISKNVLFKKAFDTERDDKIVEHHFLIENDGCELNAVYTYKKSSDLSVAVLIIPGSGPMDYNGTVGLLEPYKDIAIGFAKNGVSSLRIDKRTLNHADKMGVKSGIKEEYLNDFTKALEFLKSEGYDKIILLGHSLGGQIALDIACNNDFVNGVILFNSSPRHLAEVARDQLISYDNGNAEAYNNYCEIAKNVHISNAKGYYYFGANDYYWASYNELNIEESIQNSNFKSLVINSTNDRQVFMSDIHGWNKLFENKSNVKIHIFNDISHYGYKIDTLNTSLLYKKTDFPEDLITLLVNFCKQEV